jgi:hypothetical protein
MRFDNFAKFFKIYKRYKLYIYLEFLFQELSEQTPIKCTSKTVCVPIVIFKPIVPYLFNFFIPCLLFIYRFRISKVDDNCRTLTGPPSTNRFKTRNQPKSASRILFCHNQYS